MTTTALLRRAGAGSMVLGLTAGRRRGEGYGGTRRAQGRCDGWGIGDHFSRRFWGDGTGLMLCHVPAPQPGRCRGPAGGGSATSTSAQEDGLGPSSLRFGAAAAHQQELHPATGTGLIPGHEQDLGGESPQLGFGASGFTCRARGRAGAHCRGPVCPGLCTPCHPRPAGRTSSVPSRNTRPLPSPASCRSGQWAAACTGARQPGTGGF